ncbi:SDR family oxidoreductase [Brevibacterium sp. CS2]|nr:SDR family oxidoreductase [Brevibacterium sp. CS2]
MPTDPHPAPASSAADAATTSALPLLEFASRSIAGATAIVTGAASGMGRATAALFALEGAHVVLADRELDPLAEVIDEIEELAPSARALAVPCDVSRPEDLSTLVDTAVEQFGGIDLLVNNAGVSRRNSVAQEDEEFERVWQEVLDINLSSAGDPRRSTGGEVRSSPGRSSTRKGLHPAAGEDRFDGSIRRLPHQALAGERPVDGEHPVMGRRRRRPRPSAAHPRPAFGGRDPPRCPGRSCSRHRAARTLHSSSGGRGFPVVGHRGSQHENRSARLPGAPSRHRRDRR